MSFTDNLLGYYNTKTAKFFIEVINGRFFVVIRK